MKASNEKYAISGLFLFWLVVLFVAGSLFSGCRTFPHIPFVNPGMGQITPHDDVYGPPPDARQAHADYSDAVRNPEKYR